MPTETGVERPPIRRTYRYRLYPTKLQAECLATQLAFCCALYNAGLQERCDAWERGIGVRFHDQAAELTEVRRAGLAPPMNSWTQIDALMRLDRAFQAFFRRCRNGEKPGYPRYRSQRRYDSLSWSFSGNAGGIAIRDHRLYMQGVGCVKLKWDRPLPVGAQLKTATVLRRERHWEVCLSFLARAPVATLSDLPEVGLDVGIASFAALSTGELLQGPRAYRGGRRQLRVAQRRVARRKRRSNRRRKVAAIVRRQHERIANRRRDHAHKATRDLVSRFGTLYVEDLAIKGMAAGMLARVVHDQGWARFLAMLDYKAAEAGSRIVRVSPRKTSQACSECGALVSKALAVRVHRCPECGYVADRDVNAARNLVRLGRSLQAPTAGVPAVA